jgi:hypothetical protein
MYLKKKTRGKAEERQERTKEELEIIYEMLYNKYNQKGINLPRLSEVQGKQERVKKRRTNLEIYGILK